MLDKIRGGYAGAVFAVLGSGPSIVDTFDNDSRLEDVVIGVNGAGKLLKPNDYFLSGDQTAHTRSWFRELSNGVRCILAATAAIYSPFFYPDDSLRHRLIGTYEGYMDEHPEAVVWKTGQNLRCVLPGDDYIDTFFYQMPDCVEPHIIMKNLTTGEQISRDQRKINYGGTSACMALQIAHVMGAIEVHLYGVEFSNYAVNYSGSNYFYEAREGEKGMTTESMLTYMDGVIEKVIKQGTLVVSHGPTRLKNSLKYQSS